MKTSHLHFRHELPRVKARGFLQLKLRLSPALHIVIASERQRTWQSRAVPTGSLRPPRQARGPRDDNVSANDTLHPRAKARGFADDDKKTLSTKVLIMAIGHIVRERHSRARVS